MANDILLQEGHPVDENLRPIKVGGKSTAIETAQWGDGARVNGNLEVIGDITGNIKDIELDLSRINSTDLTIDDSGTIVFDSGDGVFRFYDAGDIDDQFLITVVGGTGATTLETLSVSADGHLTLDADGDVILDPASGIAKFYLAGDTDDLCTLTVAANGATTLATADSDGTAGNLTLDADGILVLDPANSDDGIHFYMNGTKVGDLNAHHSATWFTLYENGGASTNDQLNIKVLANGEVEIITLDAAGAVAHLNIEADGHVEFDGCAVGFDLVAPTYNASDTDVDFTTGNKQYVLFGSGNITDLNLIFPDTSGNFVLLLKQDGTGSRTVTNYKAWDLVNSDAADGSATVKFAGGSNPTLTTDANHVDILSFFWDADNEIAYGVASLDFQF